MANKSKGFFFKNSKSATFRPRMLTIVAPDGQLPSSVRLSCLEKAV
jgi:hypothetical protein